MPSTAELTSLTAVSPVDGRYGNTTAPLREHFSEYALIKHRVIVEVEWLLALAREGVVPELPPFDEASIALLQSIASGFDVAEAQKVKAIEKTTNHDVKAVEYYLKETALARDTSGGQLAKKLEFFHFACTSEDINNLAYARMTRLCARRGAGARDEAARGDARQDGARARRGADALAHARAASDAHDGGQGARERRAPAAPRARRRRERTHPGPKIAGAVGNYNAHLVCCPHTDWPAFAKRFVEGLGLEFNPYVTQIEPHDFISALFDATARFNTILLDLCRDMWGYISLGYFKQRVVAGEVGSSTMPHKVNPIDFENAEGNLGLANALLGHLGAKLPVSRWQRDLTDSTVIRNMGVALAHALIAYQAALKGLSKVQVNVAALEADLDSNWEVLAEPIQMVMRLYDVPSPYEKLKELTRGRRVDAAGMRAFVQTLEIPEDAKTRLLELTPGSYIGEAAKLARAV
ncbi:adenylosuccinate lyase [Chrysochromulina tobinii]|uniref:Adenylosuccinate lyase n=1 Tax=Chrysochromulina tobinii TaxID=1460289 RepID=A0A0M0JII6_9EUKA|nr:adenylosuccinate lyase [Chrysochromulina tobinii]|eukprot:KOO26142.1 adenylosuccinate lyase [Chrysochromulina sp. CCMP291]